VRLQRVHTVSLPHSQPTSPRSRDLHAHRAQSANSGNAPLGPGALQFLAHKPIHPDQDKAKEHSCACPVQPHPAQEIGATSAKEPQPSPAFAGTQFCSAVDVLLVPLESTPAQRLKHYIIREFAQRHILPMSIAAGTPAEASELGSFYDALPQLIEHLALGSSAHDVSNEFHSGVLESLNGSMRCVLWSRVPQPTNSALLCMLHQR
jgi:hypothetical protein